MRSRIGCCGRPARAAGIALLVSLFSGMRVSSAATITIDNADAANVGFNDPSAATPVGGNPGTTRGQQALNAFQYAANLIGSLLYSEVEIVVRARFAPDPQLACSSSWAVLGGASPSWVCITDAVNDHPDIDLLYPGALCKRLAGDTGQAHDIEADFNGRVGQPGCLADDGWYFGLNASGPFNSIDLVSVVLHELAHGLGFLTYAHANGIPLNGTRDVFMVYAYDSTQQRYWYQMNSGQRAASAENNLGVSWRGPRTLAAARNYLMAGTDLGRRPLLHTPSIYQPGSSVSHFTSQSSPNLLMEPSIASDLDHGANGIDITLPFLQDIGWRDPGCNNGLLEDSEACDDGALNSDTGADACRTSCELPICGDGATDSDEECDDGAQNSFDPGHCRPGCLDFECGDAIVDTGEECDEGANNANVADVCRTYCRLPACGDDVLDTGEQCDDGNELDGDGCSTSCQFQAVVMLPDAAMPAVDASAGAPNAGGTHDAGGGAGGEPASPAGGDASTRPPAAGGRDGASEVPSSVAPGETDGGRRDAGTLPRDPRNKGRVASCSCRVVGSRSGVSAAAWAWLLGVALLRRRKRGAPGLIEAGGSGHQ